MAHACIYNRCGYFLSAGHCPRRWPLLGIFGGAACGLAGLGAVALLGPLTGVALPLNALTAGTAVILGLPGIILLMVLNLL